MLLTTLPAIRFASVASWTSLGHGIGVGLAVWVTGTWILRTAVILHNKKMVHDPDQPDIAVPGWSYAAWVMVLASLVDAALLWGILSTGGLRADLLVVAFIVRLPIHAAVLSRLLPATYREAMIVQVFEFAIAMVLGPVIAAVVGVVYLA